MYITFQQYKLHNLKNITPIHTRNHFIKTSNPKDTKGGEKNVHSDVNKAKIKPEQKQDTLKESQETIFKEYLAEA